MSYPIRLTRCVEATAAVVAVGHHAVERASIPHPELRKSMHLMGEPW
jgi:hypothetical protein